MALGTSKLNCLDPQISIAWCMDPGHPACSQPRGGVWTPQVAPVQSPVPSAGSPVTGTQLAGTSEAKPCVVSPLFLRAWG